MTDDTPDLDAGARADDSVLERLNSVLEPARTIVLAERGGQSLEQSHVVASEDFRLVATMNPGGDFGKKELSPALRNRFTEIWVPAVSDRRDLEMIVNNSWAHADLHKLTSTLFHRYDVSSSSSVLNLVVLALAVISTVLASICGCLLTSVSPFRSPLIPSASLGRRAGGGSLSSMTFTSR